MAYDGSSDFVGETPQVDIIPSSGASLPDSSGWTHNELHDAMRDSISATQQWLKDFASSVRANGWVTTARIATMAVTNDKIASVSITKLTGTPLFSSLRSSSTVQADTFVRAGSGTGNPFFAVQRFGGTLNDSGSAAVAHNILGGNTRVIGAWAFHRGGSGEAVPLAVLYVDGADFVVHPMDDQPATVDAARSQPWRGGILYTEDMVAW